MPLPGLTKVIADRTYPQRVRSLLQRSVTALPAAMATPPTIGTAVGTGTNLFTGTNASALTNPVSIPYFKGAQFTNGPDTGRFRTSGWTLGDSASGDSQPRHAGKPKHPGGYTGGSLPYSVEGIYFGQAFEIRVAVQAGGSIRLYVDGVPNALTGTAVSGLSAGGSYLIPVTFSDGAKTRKIRIEMYGTLYFGGVVIGGQDVWVATSRASLGPQILLIGDSYSDGANGVGPLDTYAHQLGRFLNADMWIDGMGGTGFVSTGGGGAKAAYLDRLTACASDARLKPDIVIPQGSTNDAPSSGSVQSAATAFFAQCRTQYPSAKIWSPGLMYPRGTLGSGMAAANTGLKTAATAGADLFIDCQAEAWFTGNSTVAVPAGNVNSDKMMSSDGVHGSPDFHEFVSGVLARRFIDQALSV